MYAVDDFKENSKNFAFGRAFYYLKVFFFFFFFNDNTT